MKNTKKVRIEIPKNLSDKVLKQSDRTCCVCHDKSKYVQIHHIDEDPANNKISNLAVLCFQCHNDTQVTGGFGKKLTAGQVKAYRKEWLKIVKEKVNESKINIVNEINDCWDAVHFNNQQGIEYAIAGVGLNQNNVVSCPKLPIFDELINQINLLNYVNIIGESGSGKSLTAFQIAYEFKQNGYDVFIYNGKDNPVFYDNNGKSIYIVDNAHLHRELSEKLQQQVNKDKKLICVYTDSADSDKSGIRITSKQAVNVLYDYYSKNADLIIPIAQNFNKKIGVNFGDTSFYWLLNRARNEKTPYYFNYIIRGASQYIKTKIDDYEKDGFCEVLTTIAIYQILNADKPILKETLDKLTTTLKVINYNDLDNKLVKKDKIIVKNSDEYSFSHVHTAINYLNQYILKSFDNQSITNKVFMHFVENNCFSNLGLLWFINNSIHDVPYSTNKYIFGLFNNAEIIEIYNKVFEKSNESYFFGVVERLSNYIKNFNDDEKINQYLEIINKSNGVDFINIGQFINMLINESKNDDYKLLDRYLAGIDFGRIIKLFNEARTEDLINYIYFFDRVSFRCKNWNKVFASLDFNRFILKIENSNLENLYIFFSLSSTFFIKDRTQTKLKNTMINKISTFIAKRPLEIWINLDYEFLYIFFGYNDYRLQRHSKNDPQLKRIVEKIDEKILADQLQDNILFHWQTISDLLNLIFLIDKEKYNRILKNIDIGKLSFRLKDLWGSDHEFYFLMTFSNDKKFLLNLIKCSTIYIKNISFDIIYWSPRGAIYLYKHSIPFEVNYYRNDNLLITGIINLLNINKDIALNLIIQSKDLILKFITRKFYLGEEKDEEKLKNAFYKEIKNFEKDVLSITELNLKEKDIILNYENYNFEHEKLK